VKITGELMHGHTGQGASNSFGGANVNSNSMNHQGVGNGVHDVSMYHLQNFVNHNTKHLFSSGRESVAFVSFESNSNIDNSSLSSLECDEDYRFADEDTELPEMCRVAPRICQHAVRTHSLELDLEFELNDKDEIGMLVQEALFDIISD
jgi:hypothetical protein